MLKLRLPTIDSSVTMVKNKRDLKSPRRNRSFTGGRPAVRLRPASAVAGGNIRVVVRVRPPNEREQGDNFSNVIKVVDDHTMVFDPKVEDEPFFYHGVQQRNRDIMKRANKNLHFTFDRVFSNTSSNKDVFESSTKALIQSLMNGYNCSVFVYGATGAGKTHTMLGYGEDPGITFQTMNELFYQKEQLSQERQFEIGMTYLEVYNETVQDLLNPGTALDLRENGKYGVIVAGIQMHRIEEPQQLFSLLDQGNRNRTQHPTDANAESSRSHAVFQVYLRMKFVNTDEVRIAKLSMIDLAGSERGAATGYSGARFTEGANINKSLLALGNCINSLADGQRHIPYRDSKLTRLLKDSLGGNCQTVMIANVSPSSLSYEDTYNTLKYAMRAKKIKSNIKKNVVNCERNLGHYVKLVDDLTREVEQLKLQLSISQQAPCKKCSEAPAMQAEPPQTITRAEVEPDSELQSKLQALYATKRQLEQQTQQLESAKQLLAIRKQLKEECDARLSGICSDTPDREQGHRRLGNVVNRLERQGVTLQRELATVQERKQQVDLKIGDMLQKTPHLQSVASIEDAQTACLKANAKAEHLQKVCEVQERELRMRDQLIEKFSDVLKPCFLQLRGHGHATDSLVASYQGLVKHLQGIRSVTWDDEAIDSEPTSTTSEAEETGSLGMCKMQEGARSSLDKTFVLPENSDNVSAEKFMAKVYQPSPEEGSPVAVLDQTRVLSQNIKRQPISAKHLMTKVYKSSSNKQSAVTRSSPRIHKENKIPFQARPVPVSNNSRGIVSGKDKIRTIRTYKPRSISESRLAAALKQKELSK